MAAFIAVGLLVLIVTKLVNLRFVFWQALSWILALVANFGVFIYWATLYYISR